jgi:hypothetical protein
MIRHIIKKHHRKALVTVPLMFLMLSPQTPIPQNGIFLKSSTRTPVIGETFFVDVYLKAQSPVNATDGILSFSVPLLEAKHIDTERSAINLWGGNPEISNSNGVVTWSGGIIKPQLIQGTQQSHILRVSFQAKQATPSTITIAEGTLLLADGTAKNILEHTSGIRIYPRPLGAASADIDGDGKISIYDITQIIRHISKGYVKTYDVNGDGLISYKDVNVALQYYDYLK